MAGPAATAFTDLKEPAAPDGDGLAGVRVVRNRKFPWDAQLGPDRTGSDLAIAVDPKSSSTVFIAWADRVGASDYTLHVRQTTDKGVTWSKNDLRTVANAKNPGLAVTSTGRVGFFYQELQGTGDNQSWVTHLEISNDSFVTKEDIVLAKTLAKSWQGDYAYLTAVGPDFYGVFSADNTPDEKNFPQGRPKYQRNVNWATKTLLGKDMTTQIGPSIDPFFFTTKRANQPQGENKRSILEVLSNLVDAQLL